MVIRVPLKTVTRLRLFIMPLIAINFLLLRLLLLLLVLFLFLTLLRQGLLSLAIPVLTVIQTREMFSFPLCINAVNMALLSFMKISAILIRVLPHKRMILFVIHLLDYLIVLLVEKKMFCFFCLLQKLCVVPFLLAFCPRIAAAIPMVIASFLQLLRK